MVKTEGSPDSTTQMPIATYTAPEVASRVMRASIEERRRIGRMALPDLAEMGLINPVKNDPGNILS